jgi:acyl-CoA thioesterase
MDELISDEGIALAYETATSMFMRGAASRSLGMAIQEMAPGLARVSMTVRTDMLNSNQTCHGGFLFTLADSAFAFACNSRNQNTVSSSCSIDYLAPAFAGDILTATAIERSRARKTGVYDVSVCNQDDIQIALFRGNSYQIRGTVVTRMEVD